MLLYVAQYAFLLSVLVQNEPNIGRLRQIEGEDKNMYEKAGCTVRCLQQLRNIMPRITLVHFQNCYDGCQSTTNGTSFPLQKIQESRVLTIICRDESSLSFQFMKFETQNQTKNYVNTTEKYNLIYFIKIHSASDMDHDKIYLSDDEFFELSNLSEYTTHNITAVAIHVDNKYSIVSKEQQYMTLRRGYLSNGVNVYNTQINEFKIDSNVNVTAMITWKPSTDISCYYEIVYYSLHNHNANNLYRTKVDVRNLSQRYNYHIKHLQFSSEYKLGIRAKYSRDRNKESDLFWLVFQTPSCVQWHQNNFNICAPVRPEILEIVQIPLHHRDDFDLKIVWKKPEHFPEYYTIRIFLLKENGSSYTYQTKNRTNFFFIPKIKLDSHQLEIHLTAYTPGGNSTDILREHIKPWTQAPIKNSLLTVMILLLGVSSMLILILFLICFRQSKFKSNTHRCHEENISSELPQIHIDRGIIHVSDDMEIDSDKVTLFEILGEGAFGRVYRGIYNDPKIGFFEVAVKMLKEMPTSEDVNGFCGEIDVMKSVKKHPNIVGIVGHCTKDYRHMLLLTEYCSLGNLVFFLREECRHLNENQLNLKITEHKADVVETNTNRNKERGSVSKQVGEFIKDFDVNVNALFTTSFHKIVGKGKADVTLEKTQPVKSCQHLLVPISVDNRTYFQNVAPTKQKEPLNATVLLDISKQIATGMEFLAKNKVVHRDLAARNVLLASNRIVKIADFGLSRDIYQENMYKKCSNGKLPIKWLALESLTHQLYTTKSDVWSYGILLYEIITLGGTPYPSIDTSNLLYMLKSGYRMEKPLNCGEALYNLMYRCWNENPAERPMFTEIIKTLEMFLDDGPEKQIKDLISPLLYRPIKVEPIDGAYLTPL